MMKMMLLALATLASVQTAEAKPDVLLVVWDATRPDHLTPYGHIRDTTPNLARLASKGTVFTNATSAAPWTMPSVAAMFSGLFAHNHGVDYAAKDFTLQMPAEVTTLAEAMKSAGYKTALYSAQGIYMKEDGFQQGFDVAKKTPHHKIGPSALTFLDEAGDDPAFIVMYYLDPHAPYEPGGHDLWKQEGDPVVNIRGCPREVDPSKFPPGAVGHCDVNNGQVSLDDAQWDRLQRLYDGELHRNDAWLGEVVEGLQSRGILEETALVFTSDHGEAFNEHERERTWHRLPYDTILHVPMIAYLPGRFPVAKVDTAVRTVDILPTLTAIAGATLPYTPNGIDLLEATKAGAADRVAVGASHFVGAPAFFRDGTHKLMFSRIGAAQVEVYNVKSDPMERKNLAGDGALVKRLMAAREEFIAGTTITLGTSQQKATDAELEHLRALGYVD